MNLMFAKKPVQVIIDLQNAVLELHKAKQQRSVTAADYAAQIKEYSQRM